MQKVYVNTKQQYKLLLLLFIFTIITLPLKSQKLDTPLDPVQVDIKDWEIGAFFGIGANYSSGIYKPECPDCDFDDNSKFGWSLGLKSDYEISKKFYIGTNIIFDDLSTDGSFRRFENVPLERADGSIMEVPIEFRHILNLEMKTIGIAPNAIWRITKWFDFRLGIFADFIISNNITHTKELLTKVALLPDGEKVKVSIPDSKDSKVVIEDQSIPDIKSLQFGIYPQINFNIPIGEETDLMIGYFMKIPFSDIREGYSHNTWRLFFGISYDLNKDEEKTPTLPKDRN